jgi:hypothetical protein
MELPNQWSVAITYVVSTLLRKQKPAELGLGSVDLSRITVLILVVLMRLWLPVRRREAGSRGWGGGALLAADVVGADGIHSVRL